MPTPSLFWTPERHKALIGLLGDGLSSREIAERLGCTKNMVIGITYRSRELNLANTKLPIRELPTLDERLKWHLVIQKGCVYPIGDPTKEWRWCGAETISAGAPYCQKHHDICWQKPRDEK
ncbi:MAG: hypothetical protein WA728_30650 [Xanthobacteraceae bacterium]